MKKLSFVIVIPVFFLIITNRIQAQNTQTKLNQVELNKQIIGIWKGDNGKGVTGVFVAKPFGTGLECSARLISKDSVIQEVKQLWGYNKEKDKIFGAQMAKGMDLELYVMWFISNTQYKVIPYDDLSNPEKARLGMSGEFKSPDMFVETTIWDNKTISITTYTRVKE